MIPEVEQWLALQSGAEEQFGRAHDDPAAAHAAKLRACIARNAATAFGSEHDFANLASYEDFASAVPVRTYEDFKPWIRRIAHGEKGVLTTEPVEGFEETSGSSGIEKLIPVTASLKREFEAAVGLWMRDLARRMPRAFAGHFYWSISPPVKPGRKTPCGLSVGLNNDLDFFTDRSASLLGSVMAVPPEVCRVAEPEGFLRATVGALLECADLSMISVWSPNFFLSLDRYLCLRLGRDNFVWSELWPGLALLSCWTDAQSAMWMPKVRERLGRVMVQGKGLLSTEGVVSVPIGPVTQAPVLALTSHFFEFRERGNGRIRLAGELGSGLDYEVILTTGGGLYRYATGDVVRSAGDFSLRFQGRRGRNSDLVGEKLDEVQVMDALEGIKGARFLAAYHGANGCGYRLYLEENADIGPALDRVEHRLMRNGYYRQALALGQLRCLEGEILSAEDESGLVEKLSIREKRKLGDVKVPPLFRTGEMEELTSNDGTAVWGDQDSRRQGVKTRKNGLRSN